MRNNLSPKFQKHIPYLCKFQLAIHELQVQLFYPSSYQILWKSKTDQILASTSFRSKGNNNPIRFDEVLEAQILMIYNKESKQYVERDTYILVNYILNSKPNDVKQLGKITLQMNKMMEQFGENTLRKSQNRFQQQKSKRSINKQNFMSNNFKCLRLQSNLYNAKLKFNCSFLHSTLSKIPFTQVPNGQFNQLDFQGQNNSNSNKKQQPFSSYNNKNSLLHRRSPQTANNTILSTKKPKTKSQQSFHLQVKPHYFKSNRIKTQNQDAFLQQIQSLPSLKESSRLREEIKQSGKNQEKLYQMLQTLERTNKNLQQKIENMNLIIKDLQSDLNQKQRYFQENFQKLQFLDHLKFQYLEMKDYVEKLQSQLQKNNQKPQIQRLWKSIETENADVRLSHFTLDQDHLKDSKNLRVSRKDYSSSRLINDSMNKDTLNQNDYALTPSEANISVSQLRQAQGSTVRMQKQLSYIEIELYEIKAELDLIKQKYQHECSFHQQTKSQLFQLQQNYQILLSDFQQYKKEAQTVNRTFTIKSEQVSKNEMKIKNFQRQLYQQRQKLQQQEYQHKLAIKHHKLQVQSLKQLIKKLQSNNEQLQSQFLNVKKILNDKQSQLKTKTIEWMELHLQFSQNVKQLQEFKKKEKVMSEHLNTLQQEINEVSQIIEEKERNEDELLKEIDEKQHEILMLSDENVKYSNEIKVLEVKIQLIEKEKETIKNQKYLEKQNGNYNKAGKQDSQQRKKNKELLGKFSAINQCNKQLISKNKQLLAVTNKNASLLIQFQKQKKQLKHINNEIQQFRESMGYLQKANQQLQKLKKINDQNVKEKIKIQDQLKALKVSMYVKNEQKQKYVVDLEQKIKQLLQENQNRKNRLQEFQNSLSSKTKFLLQIEQQLNKQKKEHTILQDQFKKMQRKAKSYQQLIAAQQSVIKENQKIIYDLQHKLRLNQPQSNQLFQSIRTSSLNNKTNNQASDFSKKDNSKTIQNLEKQLSELKNQIEFYKNKQQSTRFSQKSNARILMELIQNYLKEKRITNGKNILETLKKVFEKRRKEDDQSQNKHGEQIISKAKLIKIELNRFKSKLMRQNKGQFSVSIIHGLKPIEREIEELMVVAIKTG